MDLEMALEYFKQLKESGESQKFGGQFNTALPLAIWALEQATNKTSEDMTVEEVFNTMTEEQKTVMCLCADIVYKDAMKNKGKKKGKKKVEEK